MLRAPIQTGPCLYNRPLSFHRSLDVLHVYAFHRTILRVACITFQRVILHLPTGHSTYCCHKHSHASSDLLRLSSLECNIQRAAVTHLQTNHLTHCGHICSYGSFNGLRAHAFQRVIYLLPTLKTASSLATASLSQRLLSNHGFLYDNGFSLPMLFFLS